MPKIDVFEKNQEAYATELQAVRQLLPPGDVKGLEIGMVVIKATKKG